MAEKMLAKIVHFGKFLGPFGQNGRILLKWHNFLRHESKFTQKVLEMKPEAFRTIPVI